MPKRRAREYIALVVRQKQAQKLHWRDKPSIFNRPSSRTRMVSTKTKSAWVNQIIKH